MELLDISMNNDRTFIDLTVLQPLQYGMCSIEPPVMLAALHWICSSLSVSIWRYLSGSKIGHGTPGMFSQGLGGEEFPLPQTVGYNLDANTARYTFGFTTRTSLCLMFNLCPPRPPPPLDAVLALFYRAACPSA